MTRYEHLNVYKETVALSKVIFRVVSKFPRDYRVTLWNKILQTNIDILEWVLIINSTFVWEREALFQKLFLKLNLLENYLKLANELHFFYKETVYISLLGNISTVTKILKNLKRKSYKIIINILKAKKRKIIFFFLLLKLYCNFLENSIIKKI